MNLSSICCAHITLVVAAQWRSRGFMNSRRSIHWNVCFKFLKRQEIPGQDAKLGNLRRNIKTRNFSFRLSRLVDFLSIKSTAFVEYFYPFIRQHFIFTSTPRTRGLKLIIIITNSK